MNPKVQTRIDQQRGCGWRKPGGIYLISAGVSSPCGMLPIPLSKCPTCSCGIKPTRGFTWIDPLALMASKTCSQASGQPIARLQCEAICPLPELKGKHGLLWIGGSFYEKPDDWTDEAIRLGVSRRIAAVPNDFVLGQTWVFVAHREVSRKGCSTCTGTGKQRMPGSDTFLDGAGQCEDCKGSGSIPEAAIFHAFKPSAIEYVVKGDETDEFLDRLMKKNITPVEVFHSTGEQPGVETEEDMTLVDQEA